MKAISIRQPWAWLIVHGYKDVENRSWSTSTRGPVLIHASSSMTRAEYTECQEFVRDLCGRAVSLPPMHDPQLLRGGIVGQAHVVDCLPFNQRRSPWHVGPWGHMLANAKPLPFLPCKGSLGYFNMQTPTSSQQESLL